MKNFWKKNCLVKYLEESACKNFIAFNFLKIEVFTTFILVPSQQCLVNFPTYVIMIFSELASLVATGTDYTGSSKYNYRTITTPLPEGVPRVE